MEKLLFIGISNVFRLMTFTCLFLVGWSGFLFWSGGLGSRIPMIAFLICAISVFHARESWREYFTKMVVQEESGNRKLRRFKLKLYRRAKKKIFKNR